MKKNIEYFIIVILCLIIVGLVLHQTGEEKCINGKIVKLTEFGLEHTNVNCQCSR